MTHIYKLPIFHNSSPSFLVTCSPADGKSICGSWSFFNLPDDDETIAGQLIINCDNDELPESLVIRITNVYGRELRNKNFVMRLVDNVKAEKDDTLKLPFDQYATPVNAEDIAKALYLLMSDKKSGVYNIASTDYVNRVQLAKRVLSYFPEHKMTLAPISTKELNPPAERPLNGGLLSIKFLNEYPSFEFKNVDDFMKEILS